MSKSIQQKARETVRSMTDFAEACTQTGLSAKKIVLNALQNGDDVRPYARAALAIAQSERPSSRPGRSSGF